MEWHGRGVACSVHAVWSGVLLRARGEDRRCVDVGAGAVLLSRGGVPRWGYALRLYCCILLRRRVAWG